MSLHDLRRHLMIAVVARLGRSPARDAFVLRGGLLTAMWIAPVPRPTRDLDLVGDFAFDVEDTYHRFSPVLAIDLRDDVMIDASSLTALPLWADTAFPGVRLRFRLGLNTIDQELSIDVGFNDPLVPPAHEHVIEGASVRTVRPETQVAWKLHALAEMGANWRPKDLADLWLITRHTPLDRAALAPAIVAAFQSRGFARARAVDLFDAPHWPTKTARTRWPRKEPLAAVVEAVRSWFAPTLTDLPEWTT